MFTDTTAKTLSHTKTLIISNPRYSVRAQHPHLKVTEVGTHPGEHTESVTTLPAPDFICPYLKVTADNCLKASAFPPCLYLSAGSQLRRQCPRRGHVWLCPDEGGQECQLGVALSVPATPHHTIPAPWLHGRSLSCFYVFTRASTAFPSASEVNCHGLAGSVCVQIKTIQT